MAEGTENKDTKKEKKTATWTTHLAINQSGAAIEQKCAAGYF